MENLEWTEVTIYTTTQGIEIVSGYIISNGIRGVVVEDANDFNEFLEDTEIHWDYIEEDLMGLKEQETKIKCYLPDTLQGIEQFNQLKTFLPNLREENASVDLGRLEIETTNINEEDWATAWKKYYHPVKVTDKLVVVPCWEEYKPQAGEVTVTLDPGMAFGTGTHETTRLCMQLVEKYVKPDSTFLDIGTGSGILAITSLLLGAKKAVGVDIDEIVLTVSHENAKLNKVDDRFEVIIGDLTEKITDKYNIVCANIVADVIIRLSQDVEQFMNSDSILLVSGIIDERADEVLNVLLSQNFKLVDRVEENGWVAMSLSL